MIETNVIPAFVNRGSFIELNGRERAQALFDKGTWRELVGCALTELRELVESMC